MGTGLAARALTLAGKLFNQSPTSTTERSALQASLTAAGITAPDPVARSVTAPIVGDGIQSPLNNVTYAAGAAGSLTGAYGYAMTYVTAQGETAAWSGSPPQVTLAGQRMNLTLPIGPAGVLRRRIYRSKAGSGEVKDTFFLVEIPDNVTTSYVDNAADNTLGVAVSWLATNKGIIATPVDGVIASFGDSGTVLLGAGARAGYASVSISGQAGGSLLNGFRNIAIGGYALGGTTSGIENVCVGVHAGQGFTATKAQGNVILGTYAAITAGSGGGQNYNVAIGRDAMNGFRGVGYGSLNIFVGYRSGYYANTADNIVALGSFAGNWADASRQVFIDNNDRGSIGGCQDIGLVYGRTVGGQTSATAAGQELRINGTVRVGWKDPTVAQLPAATTTLRGYRAYVTDASAAYASANVGATVTGGGANVVPVFCTGAAWVIG